MSANSCKLYPEAPNGEDSEMYKDLLNKYQIRPMVNWLYASYKASNLADVLDQAGCPRNAQGEHNAKDITDYLDFDAAFNEISDLHTEEFRMGAVDSNGERIDYTEARTPLEKADAFNKTHKGLVATVAQYGNVYNIIVAEKDSRTHLYADRVSQALKVWDIYKQVFNAKGVDIESLPSELGSVFNALNTDIAKYLKGLQAISMDNIYKRDAMILMYLSPNSKHIKNVINSFGSIEAAADAINDVNHGVVSVSMAQLTLLKRAIKDAQTFQGIDIDALTNQVDGEILNMQISSPEEEVHQKLKELNRKYNIDINEIHLTSDRIDSLSKAAAKAMVIIQRQIRDLKRRKGTSAEGKKLENIMINLSKELSAKKYYSGVMKFMQESSSQIIEIDNMLKNLPQTGTNIEKAFGTARILTDIMHIKNQYYDLVSALADKSLVIDESINPTDIDTIRQEATKLKEFFDGKEKIISDLGQETMIKILRETVGDTLANGQPVANAVRLAAADSSIFDYLYSMGRASNPIVNCAGTIIRNAQDSRDATMNEIAQRVRKITDRLYKSGSNSEFMYEDESHIISDIDWAAYDDAKKTYRSSLNGQKLSAFEIKQKMEEWEERNTEDRVVDTTNGRTERVPDLRYRKFEDFREGWTKEQNEYYDTMMQIKGEIGSLLPAIAQQQYLPPQVRRNFLDAIQKGDYGKAFKNKFEDFIGKVREDDANFGRNGIIDGQEYDFVQSDDKNHKLRQIPIFYINKVEAGELSKDFSGGIQALAGTAINYEAMNSIAQVIDFIQDFSLSQNTRESKAQADIINDKFTRVVQDLWLRMNNNHTNAIMEGFVSQHVYGQKLDDKLPPRLVKIANNILAYTSFRALATNVPGAVANYIMGEFQMLIEAGCGEFYGFKDFAFAHSKLFGKAGVMGDLMELVTNNVNHKSVLMRELFDPLQENFSNKSHKRYYPSMFRQMISLDCGFLGYKAGEYLIHYVNMYSILHKNKVLYKGYEIPMFDAFEVVQDSDNNSKLELKQGVTDLDGNPITKDYIDKLRKRIRYANQTCHGSMNTEDKGIIHQFFLGRMAMNFRQWMVEHYSRRFRGRHFDATLNEYREGYWKTMFDYIRTKDTKNAWDKGDYLNAVGLMLKDFGTFMFRAQAQWHNLTDMQKYNVKRVRSEMTGFILLTALSFALGDPDRHKKEFWRRFWIYQTQRMIMDTEASMPHPKAISSLTTILQSPMASVQTMSSFLYIFYGLYNGDLLKEIQSGDHKGEIKYWRNIKKYVLPIYKDVERLQTLDKDDALFKVFEDTPSNH